MPSGFHAAQVPGVRGGTDEVLHSQNHIAFAAQQNLLHLLGRHNWCHLRSCTCAPWVLTSLTSCVQHVAHNLIQTRNPLKKQGHRALMRYRQATQTAGRSTHHTKVLIANAHTRCHTLTVRNRAMAAPTFLSTKFLIMSFLSALTIAARTHVAQHVDHAKKEVLGYVVLEGTHYCFADTRGTIRRP